MPRVAVAGAGYWGKNLVRNFHILGALRRVCDAREEVRAWAAKSYPGVAVEPDFDRICADPEIDAVVLATPAATHDAMARAALAAGKHVLVEKPLALKVEHGRALCELAETKGKVLMVGHLLRYHPAVHKLEELVRGGALGKLRYVYANRLNFGKLRAEENILWSFAPHDISLILHLVGQAPDQVLATGATYLNEGIPDVTVTHLRFPNGVRAHIHVSWLHPYKDQRLVIIGDRGMIVFDDVQPWASKLMLYDHEVAWIDRQPVAQKAEGRAIPVEESEPLRAECAHFLEAVRGEHPALTDGREGLAVLGVLEAAQRSLETTGKPVELAASAPTPSRWPGATLHPTVQVEGEVQIGEGTKVWHFSKLMGPLRIGKGCSFGQNVVIEKGVQVGDNVKVQNNVSLYSGVILEDDVFCGPSMVFTNVGTPRSHYPRRGKYETTLVKRGASIGANATIVCGSTLGRYTFVGAGAVVTKDVPDHALVYGNPARIHGWVCYCGIRLGLGVGPGGTEEASCPECSRAYRREGLVVQEIGGTAGVSS
jgi:UDP-2-acetamido-3-amino-2,3-dideoxy-glucuronate N-acetyltransferase